MLEQIRSLPKRLPRGRFVRCKTAGKCRYGGNCRYAHSEAEQEAWNAQLASTSSSDSKIGSAFKVLSQPKQKRKKSYSQQHIPQLLPQGRDYPRGRSKRRLFSESSANSGNDYQLSPHYVHPGREPQVHPYVPPVVESIPTLNAVHTVTPTLDTMSDTPPEEAEEWPSLSPATTPVVYVQLRRHSSTKEDGITPLTWPLATAATPDPSVPVHTNQSSPQAHIATQDLDEIQRHFPALFGSSSPSHQPLENPRQLSSSSVSVQSSSGTRTMAVSRLNEYEVNDVIGKGGFGVVFHVKNNTDECEYALKIIRLSDNLKKQEKVLREVRALAKLKGPHIVRYYNSWMEKAPDGWREKELWSMLKSSDSLPLIPVTTAMGSTPTTPSSTHTTNTSTSTHVVSSDLSQSVFGLTSHTADSVVSFRDSANSPPAHSQAVQPLITETDVNAKFPEIQLANPLDPPTCLFIQTELCQRDTLRTWLGKNCEENSRPKIKVMNYFKQILEALVYIHGEKFVHRDLKPSNIFFSCSEDRLKIGDFGLARKTMTIMHGGLAPTGVDTTNHGSADSHSKGSMQAGTALYMSPEQVKGENCDEKSDMFALGIILFELHYIMEARNQVLTALRNLEFPPKFEENHLNVTRIVKLLLAENPAERPTADELTKNKYLKNLAKKAKKSKSVGLTL